MLEILPNEKKNGIQMLFSDFFTQEKQFVTGFDLKEAKEIGWKLIALATELETDKEMNHG